MQQLFYFYRCSVWGGMGRVMVTTAPPPSALPISKVPPWRVHDLIAHRQTDAAATGLGGALVEFLLHIGQLRRGMPGPKSRMRMTMVVLLPPQGGDDALAGAAVLGGVVQHVAQHLLQPFRIAGDRIGAQFAVVVILRRMPSCRNSS